MGGIIDWLRAEPAAIIDLAQDGAIQRLVAAYCGRRRTDRFDQTQVLTNLLHTVRWKHRARTAVVEYRYTDVDYQDEHARFYAQTFRQYPATTHRMHFFLGDPPSGPTLDALAELGQERYLGYVVLRPVPGATVGRTMLRAPSDVSGVVTCAASDTVNLLGVNYRVDAAPFIAQDYQLGVCAHAATWMSLYFYRLRYGTARVLPGEIATAVPTALTVGRSVPSSGMTIAQLTEVLEKFDLPPVVYPLTSGAKEARIATKIARRYLDSGMPLIVATDDHALTLVGYRSDTRGRTEYIIHDDEVGPYLADARPPSGRRRGAYKPWRHLVVPMPEQIYIRAEEAEEFGQVRLNSDLNFYAQGEPSTLVGQACKEVLSRIGKKRNGSGVYTFVTSAIRSNEFKSTLLDRNYSREIANAYMWIPMSKWIWVVELVDLERFLRRQPAVVMEVLIDSTEHARDHHFIAWRVPGTLWHWESDRDIKGQRPIELEQPLAMSVCATSRPRNLGNR